MTSLDDTALDLIFREARTVTRWQDKAVDEAALQALWDLVKMGPTSANCSPLRVIFATSDETKARLKPLLSSTNVEQTMAAPVVAILAYDTAFYEHLPRLFMAEAVAWFTGSEAVTRETAFRNGTLQGAYLILAARALALDCGPMSGFDNAGVDAEFFADPTWRSNFLVNLGYGDRSSLEPRAYRFTFDEACQIT